MSPVDPSTAPPTVDADPDALADRIRALAADRDRLLVGLTGGPGSGKSTLAETLQRTLGPVAAVVPMDGFHLAQAVLASHGTAEVKGAPHTFDGAGYLALLRRLRTETDGVVYAPTFDRSLEEPIAGAIPVGPDIRIVLTEGNYLLLDTPPWRDVAALLDAVWFLDPGDDQRVQRLVDRHVRFGRTAEQAVRRATVGSDADNAVLIATTRGRADLVVRT